MIIVLKRGVRQKDVTNLISELVDSYEVQIHPIEGSECTDLGLVGATSKITLEDTGTDERIHKVMRVKEPFKKANRAFHPENSIIRVGESSIGGDEFAIIAGPCSVESEDQITEIAKSVQSVGATFLRGGAYKPRTSPYAFQGLEEDGLELLKKARAVTGLPIVTEIMYPETIEKFVKDVDVIQVGARNMQNFTLH